MRSRIIKVSLMVMIGIIFVLVSLIINWCWGWLQEGDDPFFFPAAFILAGIYGWWIRSFVGSFLVGLLAIPYMLPLQMNPWPLFVNSSVLGNLAAMLFGRGNNNFLEIAAFSGLGIVSGLFGIGMAKLSLRRIKVRN